MHPTERGKVTTVLRARDLLRKGLWSPSAASNRIGIRTLDDRSGRLEAMLFTDALDKYQQLLKRPHTYRQRTGQL